MSKPKPNRWITSTTNQLSTVSSTTKNGIFAVATFVAIVLFIFHPLPSYYGLNMSGGSSSNKAFSLIVELKFQDVASKEEFVQLIQPLMEYVRLHEPTTIGYEVLLSDKDDLRALLLERYADKEDAYLKIHKSSKEFLEFRPKLQAMQEAGKVTLSGHSYLDADIGFVGRT